MEFYKGVEDIVKRFNETDKYLIKIVSHLDCDGITAASIMIKTFQRMKLRFSCMIVRQLTSEIIRELNLDSSDTIIFCDLGSGSLNDIMLLKKNVFILDHHLISGNYEGLNFINPQMYGLNYEEVSGAGLAYLFSKGIDKNNIDLAYLAIIGAVGDLQENRGFKGINEEILKDALNKIEIKKGLRMFGMQTKPLHKILEYSTDPYIPGVTGNEQGAVMFLKECGIELKNENNLRRLIDLNDDELKRLVTGVILKRMGSETNPEDIFGDIYILKNEEEGLPTRDAKEFSTLINACGRVHKPSIGLGLCLGNKRLKDIAFDLLKDYKLEIIDSLNWFHSNKTSEDIIEGENFLIINAKENVKDSVIGTLAGMVAKSNLYKDNTIIVAMANTVDDNIKVSARVCGKANESINLRDILVKITDGLKVEVGGHKLAAGCLIEGENEKIFIEHTLNILKN